MARKMAKVYAKSRAQLRSRRFLWATFTIDSDAFEYAEMLRKRQPTWQVDVVYK